MINEAAASCRLDGETRVIEPKDIGVLLRGPLVRKFLTHEKTVTRRTDLKKWAKARPGDRIWFRETHCNIAHSGYPPVYIYRADEDDKPHDRKWTPSLLMKKEACRCWAIIEDIREEKLHDITAKEIIAEGVVLRPHDDPILGSCPISVFDGKCYVDLLSLWSKGWDSINGKKPGLAWSDNPTVARIKFRRIEVSP